MAEEHDIETAACEYAEEWGLEHRKLQWVGRISAPDRILWGELVPVFMIEFKASGEDLEPSQFREIERIRKSGTRVYVCDNLVDAKQCINEELRRSIVAHQS